MVIKENLLEAATAAATVYSKNNKNKNHNNFLPSTSTTASTTNITTTTTTTTIDTKISPADSSPEYIMDCAKIGRTIKTALLKAQAESRVIVGLSAAISVLSKAPRGSLFCLMAVPQDGDSATHMHEVLLEAFCYENDIYVLKVDCPTKLSRILGKNSVETCCLVQKTWAGGEDDDELLNKSETILVDYCEAYWDAPNAPVIELPAV